MDRFNRVSVYVFLLLVGILYGAWLWSTGPIGDDLWYSRVFEDKEGGGFVDSSLSFALSLGNQIETLSEALNSIINHYLYWNNFYTSGNRYIKLCLIYHKRFPM